MPGKTSGASGKSGLLDAEVRPGEIELQVGGVPDRRDISRAVPGRAHPEELAEGGQLAGRGDPADVGDVDADEVDQPVLDQRQVLVELT